MSLRNYRSIWARKRFSNWLTSWRTLIKKKQIKLKKGMRGSISSRWSTGIWGKGRILMRTWTISMLIRRMGQSSKKWALSTYQITCWGIATRFILMFLKATDTTKGKGWMMKLVWVAPLIIRYKLKAKSEVPSQIRREKEVKPQRRLCITISINQWLRWWTRKTNRRLSEACLMNH